MKNKKRKSAIKMMLTKRRKCIKDLTDIRFFIKLNQLKLPNLGRIDNIVRICESDLSWQKRIEWAKRISEYDGSRQETLEYYTILYNSKNKAKEIMNKKSERMKGVNNPWHDHEGKYSPFKKGSMNYNPDTIRLVHDNLRAKGNYTTKLEYYLNKGYSKEEADKMLSERQSVGRQDKFIERYGEKEGIKRWEERQRKWQNTLNEKPIEERTRINSLKNSKGGSVSKNELELFNELKKFIDSVERTLVLYYNNGKNYYTYDIFSKDKIIEYNGDFWHANPKIYSENFYNKTSKKTAKEIWSKEKHKEQIAKENSFSVYRVWESDYNRNKEKVIKECINFLKQ